MGQDKLFELLAIQFCRNPLPMLAFHHFRPQKDGDFRGLARPQQKTQKDLSHQRPKDKFNQSEKPATSRLLRGRADTFALPIIAKMVYHSNGMDGPISG
jgi:hypothetical protein